MMLTEELKNSRFMRAARCEPVDTTPVWIMRQAGRYLPEYQAVRSGHEFLEFCKRPDLSAQVTLDAQAILGVDAAILFADLPTILEPMGFQLDYAPGPEIGNPFRTGKDLDRVRELEDIQEMNFVYETVRLVRKDLPGNIPLLGFAGAPFTLASYAIEGGGSKNYIHTKRLMYNEPAVWHELMQRFTSSLIRYLRGQIEAGCQAVQLFDSWAGCLTPGDYREYVLPHTKAVIDGVADLAPVINFLTGNPALLKDQVGAGGQIIGIDWRIELNDAWKIIGYNRAVQGNMDPVSLFADLPELRRRTQAVMDAAEKRNGHIFNLGHGVMPEMNPDHVKALVRMVHEMGAR